MSSGTAGPWTVHRIRTSKGIDCELGPVGADEVESLFNLFSDIVATGQGYPHRAPLTRESFEATWVKPVSMVAVARVGGTLAGAYYLKPNFVGKADHIANAGYIVHPDFRRYGIGRALLEDSIFRAPLVGYDAIQFNLVFESNPARRLYESLGWQEIGRVPKAVDGEDAIIYWRGVG